MKQKHDGNDTTTFNKRAGPPGLRAFRMPTVNQPGHVHHGGVGHLEAVGGSRRRGGAGHQAAVQDEISGGIARGSNEVRRCSALVFLKAFAFGPSRLR